LQEQYWFLIQMVKDINPGAGASMVADINAGPGNSNPSLLFMYVIITSILLRITVITLLICAIFIYSMMKWCFLFL
jgi:hypothetical protein